jgi:hypothetical protein
MRGRVDGGKEKLQQECFRGQNSGKNQENMHGKDRINQIREGCKEDIKRWRS